MGFAVFLHGEGETTPIAEFSHRFIDSVGQPIAESVEVGQTFQLQTFVGDTRGPNATGISSAFLDIGLGNSELFDVAVSEIQTLKFFHDQLDLSQTGSSFTVNLDGLSTVPISLVTPQGALRSAFELAQLMQAALVALPNIGQANVLVAVDHAAALVDELNGIPRLNFEIRFANQLAGQDLRLLTLDPNDVALIQGGTFEFSISERLAGDQTTPAAKAMSVIFSEIYDFARHAEVDSTRFNDIGGATTALPIPSPAQPKLLFSVPLIAKAPGIATFAPADAGNSPATDILSGTMVIPPSMVSFGQPFALLVVADAGAPVAIDDTISIAEDSSFILNGNVTTNDIVTSPRTLEVFSAAATATTVGSLNGLTYTPPADFFGTDIVTYVAKDSAGLSSNTATVTINVTPVNDAPTAPNATFTVSENSTDNRLAILTSPGVGPGPNESESIIITAVGTEVLEGMAVISTDGSSVLYTPPTNFRGFDRFSYTITDAGGLSATGFAEIQVRPETLPSAVDDLLIGLEGSSASVLVLTNDFVHPNAEPILLSFTQGTFGTIVTGIAGEIVYTSNEPNFYGTDSFTYTMNDSSGLGSDSTATVHIQIQDVNDPPILNNDSFTTSEDAPLVVPISQLLVNDSPGAGEEVGVAQAPQTLTLVSIFSMSQDGSVMLDGENVVFTPTSNFNGDLFFSYTVEDSGMPALSSTAVVTIDVISVNDPPIAGADAVVTVEDQSLSISIASLMSNDSPGPANEAGQQLSIAGVSATSGFGGSVTIGNGIITYVPAPDYYGTDSFIYVLNDSAGGTSTGTVNVTVAPTNDAPIAGPDSLSTFADTALSIAISELLANDSAGPANESLQSLSIVSITATPNSFGTVVISSADSITYTPTPGFVGQATFEYTLQDSGPDEGANTNQSTGIVSISVLQGVPDLVATDFSVSNSHVLLGMGTISGTIFNAGNGASGNFNVQLVWSDDEVIGNADDIIIGTQAFDSLPIGASVRRENISFSLDRSKLFERAKLETPPNQNAGFQSLSFDRLAIVIDPENTVHEQDENNNSNQGLGIDLTSITYFPWDINGNGEITPTDVIYILNRIGQTDQLADLDGNGLVTPTEAISAINRLGYLRNDFDTLGNPDQFLLNPGALRLDGVSESTFNSTAAPLRFKLEGAQFLQDLDQISLRINGLPIAPAQLLVTSDTVVASSALVEGKNEVALIAVDTLGRPLYLRKSLWAGSATLRVELVDEIGMPFLEETTVEARLSDDPSVAVVNSTSIGFLEIQNAPFRTLLIKATASGNRTGYAGEIGTKGTLQVRLVGFEESSPIENNDFSLGTLGWNVGDSPVQVLPHVEGFPGASAPNLADSLVSTGAVTQKSRQICERLALANDSALAAGVGSSISDNDLTLTTTDEGEESVSRTFSTTPGTNAVRVRYRYITSEVPGGYFGSEYNDYYRVAIRSQNGGGFVTESNTMNGLGLAAFDYASGATAWREILLDVSPQGDTVQVDLGVANVRDGLFDSQVVVDFVEEIRDQVTPSISWNNTRGGINLSYSVEHGSLTDAKSIMIYFASGTSYNDRLGGPVFTHTVDSGTPVGTYGDIAVDGTLLGNAPTGTTHLIAVASETSIGTLADVSIVYGANADSDVVDSSLVAAIKNAMRVAGQESTTITSTARSVSDQARAMFVNLTNPANSIAQNIATQINIYAAAGDAVINTFAMAAAGLTRQQVLENRTTILAAMEQEILNQGPQNVSRHCADPPGSVVDVAAGDFNSSNASLFESAIRSRVRRFIDESSSNGCYHLEW
ncbi:MAG: tandem-95 repeat protein [Planctomycetales bacterium]|nr:tandem-95 repeat protein [Planctomycetales bacterium]